MSILPAHLLANRAAPFSGSRYPELLCLHKPQNAQHLVQFYEDESFIIENVSFLAAHALVSGDSSVIVATEPHLRAIRERIAAHGLNLNLLQKSGLYVPVDASEALARFMVDRSPDRVKFNQFIGGILSSAENQGGRGFVFAFGEMVDLLCAAKNPQAAVHLEQLWNDLATRHHFSLYCAYSLSSLGDVPDADALMRICAEHSLTIPSETPL
jgi:hypothetical protein